LTNKYVVFKDDDVGKDFIKLKRWIDIVIKNNAKGAIGLIGKYMKDKNLSEFLNALDEKKIEVFCHGYSHSYLPFLLHRYWNNNRAYPIEFNRNEKSHNKSFVKYREAERKYLKRKAICFGPPGNTWNDDIISPAIKNGFIIMFSSVKTKKDLMTLPISNRYKQDSLEEFIKMYKENADHLIYTLQFHHADLSEKQFELLPKVIDFLKNKEGRIFVTPSELLEISKKDKNILNLISPKT
jgi:hypothetical protein